MLVIITDKISGQIKYSKTPNTLKKTNLYRITLIVFKINQKSQFSWIKNMTEGERRKISLLMSSHGSPLKIRSSYFLPFGLQILQTNIKNTFKNQSLSKVIQLPVLYRFIAESKSRSNYSARSVIRIIGRKNDRCLAKKIL